MISNRSSSSSHANHHDHINQEHDHDHNHLTFEEPSSMASRWPRLPLSSSSSLSPLPLPPPPPLSSTPSTIRRGCCWRPPLSHPCCWGFPFRGSSYFLRRCLVLVRLVHRRREVPVVQEGEEAERVQDKEAVEAAYEEAILKAAVVEIAVVIAAAVEAATAVPMERRPQETNSNSTKIEICRNQRPRRGTTTTTVTPLPRQPQLQ